jgi:hypothetical protein
MATKFSVGDKIARTGYEKFASERMTVLGVVSDEHPICPRLWYVTVDDRGDKHNGLVGIVDDCFHKIEN